MADIQISEDEINLVTALLKVSDELTEANSRLDKLIIEMNEAYKGDLNEKFNETFTCMQEHISKLQYFYGIGANYILKTWEKFSEADQLTAGMYIYQSLYGGE